MVRILITLAKAAPPIARTITTSDSHVGTSGTQEIGWPPLRNGSELPCRASMMSLTPDEAQHHGQAQRKIDELVKQLSEQEVQLLQTEQCEHVGREHDERIFGQAEKWRGSNRKRTQRRMVPMVRNTMSIGVQCFTPFVDSTQLFAVVFIGDLDDPCAVRESTRSHGISSSSSPPGDEF